MFTSTSMLVWLSDILQQLPWPQALQKSWNYLQNLLGKTNSSGLYDVRYHEATLELLDSGGHKAKFYKRQVVSYLQDGIIAYQDHAWADGEFLLDYQCSPGVAVDFYQPGRKVIILISLRGIRNRGDTDEHHMEWGIRDGFLRAEELWETEINHPTRLLKIRVIFPKARPPLQAVLIEDIRHIETPIGDHQRHKRSDGRWEIEVDIPQPRLHERYELKWIW